MDLSRLFPWKKLNYGFLFRVKIIVLFGLHCWRRWSFWGIVPVFGYFSKKILVHCDVKYWRNWIFDSSILDAWEKPGHSFFLIDGPHLPEKALILSKINTTLYPCFDRIQRGCQDWDQISPNKSWNHICKQNFFNFRVYQLRRSWGIRILESLMPVLFANK